MNQKLNPLLNGSCKHQLSQMARMTARMVLLLNVLKMMDILLSGVEEGGMGELHLEYWGLPRIDTCLDSTPPHFGTSWLFCPGEQPVSTCSLHYVEYISKLVQLLRKCVQL